MTVSARLTARRKMNSRGERQRVMIQPAGYDAIRPAVERAFELFPVDCKGKVIFIKPNVLRSSDKDEGIVTHPAVLRAVVEKVETMGPAQIVVGDNPGLFSYGANEESFRRTGLLDAAGKYYRNIGSEAVQLDFNPEFSPSVSVSRIVTEADVVISLPKFKTHGLTVMTGAIKNCYGFLPGAQKAFLHKAAGSPERFHEMVVDVFRLRVPDLFIVDGVVGMEGNGPATGQLRQIGLILASDNGVALDAVIAYMMGCEPGLLKFLQKARNLGLGEYDLDKIDVIGELKRIPGFELPPLGGEVIAGNPAMSELFHGRTLLRPRVDRNLCSGCGTCIDHCTVEALSMEKDYPKVDADTCITCFCCQELCPEKAIRLE